MRIAAFVVEFPSLSETFVLNQLTGLLDRGHDVEVFPLLQGDLQHKHEDVDRYRLMERAVFPRPAPRGVVAKLTSGLALAGSHLAARPVVSLRCLNPRLLDSLASPFNVLRAAEPILRGAGKSPVHFDVVHAHFGPAGIRAAQLLEAKVLSGPLVVTFYGNDVHQVPKLRGRDVYRRMFQTAERIFALSERMAQQLISLGAPAKKVAVHHLGVDPDRFLAAELNTSSSPRNDAAVEILTIARLVEKKGVGYALEAVAELRRNYLPVRLTIVGDGPLRGELEETAKRLGLSPESVRFLGAQPSSKVRELLQSAQILLAPSVSSRDGDEEGTPTVILEAMASGLPVVATTHSGIPEQVRHGVTGLLAPERDAEALARLLTVLVVDAERRSQYGRRGREIVLNQFDVRRLNDQLESSYRELAA